MPRRLSLPMILMSFALACGKEGGETTDGASDAASIFESMVVVIDGVSHDGATTLCQQPPLVAARDMATALQEKYVP